MLRVEKFKMNTGLEDSTSRTREPGTVSTSMS